MNSTEIEIEEVPHTSWSEIDTARHCLRKHHLRYKGDRWQLKEDAEPLRRGSSGHKLMELLYDLDFTGTPIERSKRVDGRIKELAAEADPDAERLEWMFQGYWQAYGYGDPMWSEHVEAAELEFLVPLPDVGLGPLNLKGIIDLVVWINNKLWVVDHKFSSRPIKPVDTEMADQWTLYCWALRQLGYPVFGSIHNYVKTEKLKRKMTMEERFQRIPIHRSDRELESVAAEATVQAHLAKMDNGAPRSPGEFCVRRCDFLDVCIADRRYGPEMAENVLQVTHKPREDR